VYFHSGGFLLKTKVNVWFKDLIEAKMLLCQSIVPLNHVQRVQLKSGSYFNMSYLFTKIYVLCYTTNPYLQ